MEFAPKRFLCLRPFISAMWEFSLVISLRDLVAFSDSLRSNSSDCHSILLFHFCLLCHLIYGSAVWYFHKKSPLMEDPKQYSIESRFFLCSSIKMQLGQLFHLERFIHKITTRGSIIAYSKQLHSLGIKKLKRNFSLVTTDKNWYNSIVIELLSFSFGAYFKWKMLNWKKVNAELVENKHLIASNYYRTTNLFIRIKREFTAFHIIISDKCYHRWRSLKLIRRNLAVRWTYDASAKQ